MPDLHLTEGQKINNCNLAICFINTTSKWAIWRLNWHPQRFLTMINQLGRCHYGFSRWSLTNDAESWLSTHKARQPVREGPTFTLHHILQVIPSVMPPFYWLCCPRELDHVSESQAALVEVLDTIDEPVVLGKLVNLIKEKAFNDSGFLTDALSLLCSLATMNHSSLKSLVELGIVEPLATLASPSFHVSIVEYAIWLLMNIYDNFPELKSQIAECGILAKVLHFLSLPRTPMSLMRASARLLSNLAHGGNTTASVRQPHITKPKLFFFFGDWHFPCFGPLSQFFSYTIW